MHCVLNIYIYSFNISHSPFTYKISHSPFTSNIYMYITNILIPFIQHVYLFIIIPKLIFFLISVI